MTGALYRPQELPQSVEPSGFFRLETDVTKCACYALAGLSIWRKLKTQTAHRRATEANPSNPVQFLDMFGVYSSHLRGNVVVEKTPQSVTFLKHVPSVFTMEEQYKSC